MFRFLRFTLTAVGLALLIIGVAGVISVMQSRRTLKAGLQHGLAYLYETKVDIQDVTLSPHNSTMLVHGLRIWNPEGFDPAPAFECETITVRIAPERLLEGILDIENLHFNDVVVHVRYEPGQGMNLQRLIRSAKRLEDAPEPPFRFGNTLHLRRLECDNMTVEASASPLPEGVIRIPVSSYHIEEDALRRIETLVDLGIEIIRVSVEKVTGLDRVRRLLEDTDALLR